MRRMGWTCGKGRSGVGKVEVWRWYGCRIEEKEEYTTEAVWDTEEEI